MGHVDRDVGPLCLELDIAFNRPVRSIGAKLWEKIYDRQLTRAVRFTVVLVKGSLLAVGGDLAEASAAG